MRHQHIASLGALLVAAVLVISGCAQPTNAKESAKEFSVRGSISGLVLDTNKAPVEGASVSYNNGRSLKTTKTNAAGMYEITDLASGSYVLLISGTGSTKTTSMIVNRTDGTNGAGNLTVPTLDTIKTNLTNTVVSNVAQATPTVQNTQWMAELNEYRVNLLVSDVTLYPLTASVTGVAYYETYDVTINRQVPTLVPEGWKIGIKFTSGISPVYFEATVGKLGVFTIEKLPATAGDAAPPAYDFYVVNSTTASKKTTANKIDDTVFQVAPGDTPTNAITARLRDGETVNLGDVTFLATIAPKVVTTVPLATVNTTVKFNPGTASSPTALVLNFSKAMNEELAAVSGNITVKNTLNGNTSEYGTTKVWTSSGTALTITPVGVAFEFGQEIEVTFANMKSTDGVAMAGVAYKFATIAKQAVAYYSWYSPLTDAKFQLVGVTASPTLTFVNTIASTVTKNMYLKEAGNIVDATFSFSEKVLTCDPTLTLKADTTYTIGYDVSDGITSTGAQTITFTTQKDATVLTAPVLAFDAAEKLYQSSGTTRTSGYNAGESTLYITYTKQGLVDGAAPTYTVEYKKATQVKWTAGSGGTFTLNNGTLSGTTQYATITNVPAWTTADGYAFRIRSSLAAVNADAVSAELTLADTVFLPSNVRLGGSTWNFMSSAVTGTTGADGFGTQVTVTAPTLYKVGYLSFNIMLVGELTGVPTVASTGTATGGTLLATDATLVSVKANAGSSTATVLYQLPMLTAATPATTYSGKTITIVLRDDSNNSPSDYDITVTGAQTPILFTLP